MSGGLLGVWGSRRGVGCVCFKQNVLRRRGRGREGERERERGRLRKRNAPFAVFFP
jgi:hypothetical protein